MTRNNKTCITVSRTFAQDCSLSLTSKIPAPNFGEISDYVRLECQGTSEAS